jgi:hypothetical protein
MTSLLQTPRRGALTLLTPSRNLDRTARRGLLLFIWRPTTADEEGPGVTGIRRRRLLLALTLAFLVGGIAPASATFADPAMLTTGVETVRVSAPESVSGDLSCGADTSTMAVTWTASSTARISGYRVNVYYSYDGSMESFDLPATATNWSASTPTWKVSPDSVAYSVTTVTDYGWFQESSRQGQFHC